MVHSAFGIALLIHFGLQSRNTMTPDNIERSQAQGSIVSPFAARLISLVSVLPGVEPRVQRQTGVEISGSSSSVSVAAWRKPGRGKLCAGLPDQGGFSDPSGPVLRSLRHLDSGGPSWLRRIEGLRPRVCSSGKIFHHQNQGQ